MSEFLKKIRSAKGERKVLKEERAELHKQVFDFLRETLRDSGKIYRSVEDMNDVHFSLCGIFADPGRMSCKLEVGRSEGLGLEFPGMDGEVGSLVYNISDDIKKCSVYAVSADLTKDGWEVVYCGYNKDESVFWEAMKSLADSEEDLEKVFLGSLTPDDKWWPPIGPWHVC